MKYSFQQSPPLIELTDVDISSIIEVEQMFLYAFAVDKKGLFH